MYSQPQPLRAREQCGRRSQSKQASGMIFMLSYHRQKPDPSTRRFRGGVIGVSLRADSRTSESGEATVLDEEIERRGVRGFTSYGSSSSSCCRPDRQFSGGAVDGLPIVSRLVENVEEGRGHQCRSPGNGTTNNHQSSSKTVDNKVLSIAQDEFVECFRPCMRKDAPYHQACTTNKKAVRPWFQSSCDIFQPL